MKRVPVKVLVVVLILGTMSIASVLLFTGVQKEIITKNQKIIEECGEDQRILSKIRELLYEHQALLVNYAINNESEDGEACVEKEKEVREELSDTLRELGNRVDKDGRGQSYHKVCSNYTAYQNNADAILSFIKAGKRNTAFYYNNQILNDFQRDIDDDLDTLSSDTDNIIKTQKQNMQMSIDLVKTIEWVCVGVEVVLTLVCVWYCVRITVGLDRYKQKLETELTEKNKALQQRNKHMLELQEGIIIGMANLIENRDGDTGEHVKRTSIFVKMLAKAAREQGVYSDVLTDIYIDRLTKVAPLHDVGKIAIPDHILNKPGKLTPEEYEEVKLHAKQGGKMIREIFDNIVDDKEFLDMAVEVASYHHEKWDGTGYMEHLKGEEIPLCARIMALADVFDALASQRCYKDALEMEEVFHIIQEGSGNHFDPKLAEVFVKLRPELEQVFRSYT